MTTDQNSTSLQNQQRPSSTGTSPLSDLVQRTVGRQPFDAESQTGVNPVPAPGLVTSVPSKSEISPTKAELEPIELSIDDAMSTSFIDIKSLGVDSWPIRGVEKWEGKVIDADDEIFTAELTPLGVSDDRPALVSEFRMKVFEGRKVKPGDVFYMTSQQVRVRGLLTTVYTFHIRKPGNWTASDIRDIRERVRQRLQLLEDNVE